MKQGRLLPRGIWLLFGGVLLLGLAPVAHADTAPSSFNLQVTPSPLVATVKPGVKSQLELKVRNGGSDTEALKIEPKAFTFDSTTGKVKLEDTAPPLISQWITFSAPKFTVQAGQWFTEEVALNIPKDAGFSYSFALDISEQNPPKPQGGSRAIAGSLAVFTLINVDKPGATSNLQVAKFTASKRVYEYLPSEFSIQFHNAGNTITQPFGNIFIGRGSGSQQPMASLTVNETKGYILPDTSRTITAGWNDGFPVYKTITNPDGSTHQKLVWNWANLSKLRIGHYTAHLVAVYAQAGRDVPIEGTVSFWVIPWKVLLVFLAVVLLMLFAVFTLIRSIFRSMKRKRDKRAEKKAAKQSPPPTSEAP